MESTATAEVFAYDGLGHLAYAENDAAVVWREFDSLGNTIEEKLSFLQGTAADYSTSMAYYDSGLLEAVTYPHSHTYPNGDVVSHSYDTGGRLDTVKVNSVPLPEYT